jgi:hypothetical protein
MPQQFGDSNIGDFYQRPSRPAASPSMTPMGDMGFQTPTKVGNNWGTPNSGSSGGGVPGGGFYGRPSENGPTLTPNLLGRYAPTERFNYLEIRGNNTDTQLGWVSIVCERPTLLVPVEQLFGSVYFAPHAIPTTFGSNSALLNAERAEGPGVVYLWAPGTWWIKYNAGDTVVAKFRQMSAEDPAIVAAAMSMPGAQRINSYNVNLGTATATLLAAANPARRAIVIQAKTSGITTTNPLYIGLNTTAPTSSLFAFALTAQFQAVTFSDEAMNTGVVYGLCAAASQTCQVTEYE